MRLTKQEHVHEVTLDNGLRVLLKEMRTAPVVSCWTWYRVGSRFERPGITGISHWCEHMMFKGSPRWPRGESSTRIAACGGYLNAFTTEDFTGYYEVVPADHAELPLDIESDRMVNAIFEPEDVESERSVIISECEGIENEPEECIYEAVRAAAFAVHSYHWPVIGYKCDLNAITHNDLVEYYRLHYTPSNAILALAGDFDAAEMLAKVEHYFGALRGPAAPEPFKLVEPEQEGERRVELRKPGSSVYLTVAYHVPAMAHEDMYPLIVLDSVLSGAKGLSLFGGASLDRSSRLHEVLVDRRQVAVEAGSRLPLNLDPGLWTFHVMVQDGVKPERAERVLFAELDRIADRGPTAKELRKALNQTRAQIEYSRDGVANNAFALGYFELMGDRHIVDTLPERIAAVTREDVVRVARKYLDRRNRTVGVFVPDEPEPATGSSPGAALPMPQPFMDRPFSICFLSGRRKYPLLQRHDFPNGVSLIGVENPDAHAVAVSGSVRAGAKDDPPGKEGLALLASAMLDEGTESRNYKKIADKLETAGVNMVFSAGVDQTGFAALCLRKTLPLALATAFECLTRSVAPEPELAKVKQQTITVLRSKDDSTSDMAAAELFHRLYPPGHPYHEDSLGTLDSVRTLTRDDVLDFMQRAYTPDRMLISVAGPLAFGAMVKAVEEVFAAWTRPPRDHDTALWPSSPALESELRINYNMAGKSQADLIVGRLGVTRLDPDRFAVRVANSIFGEFGLMGRLGDHIREKLGLAYYCYSEVKTSLRTGQWLICAGVNQANLDKTLDAVRVETDRLCQDLVTDEELENTRGHILGSLPLRLERSQSLVALAHDIGFYDLGLDYLERAEAEVQAVTRERVRDVARKYLARQSPIISVAGPVP